MSPPRAAALASTLRVGAGLLALALVVGCGASAPPPTRSAPEAPVRLGPLLDHVPGEPAWMALGSPSILLEEPSLRTVVDSIAPAEWRERFELRTGVRLGEVQRALVLGYGEGRFLILARLPDAEQAAQTVTAAGMRMNTVEVSAEEPFARRVGFLGTQRREWVAVGDVLVVGAGVGPEIAELLAAVRAERALPWTGPDTDVLRARHEREPAVWMMPRPLELPVDSGLGLLLARERALAASLDVREGRLWASLTLRGELPPGADANFRQLAASLANSDLGAVVGLNLAERELAVRVDGEQAHLEAPWPADVLARGLRVLFVDELEALLEEPVLAR